MATVLLVDDEPNVLDGLELSLADHFQVLMVASGPDALSVIRTSLVDVIVADERMPVMGGGALLTLVRELNPDIVRILLTGQASVEAAAQAINAARVFRFLQKPCPPATLLQAIRDGLGERAAAGGGATEASVEFTGLSPREHGLLTEREREVLKLVVQGLRTASVAERLFLSPHTVRSHLKVIFRKLGVSSRADLIRRARS